jgi:CRISPR system Cascade subunit CasA
MPFNLLSDPFFPIVTRAGQRRMVSFAQLAQIDGDDAPADFAWPRSDLNIAAFEFAIGIATILYQPETEPEWREQWNNPPTPEDVAADVASWLPAFNLDGEGPRFLQDSEAFEAALTGDAMPIEALLIDTPGANGQKKNADLLTHRDRYAAFGLAGAAIVLHAMQQFAPSGGAGNRTSMRGGGPMTALVAPAGEPCLWRMILANLPLLRFDDVWTDGPSPRLLPWLGQTLLSDKAHGERVIHQSDPRAHRLQAFFGMPRRLRLVLSGQTGICPLTGEEGPLVSGFVQKPWGPNYGLWQHPLTPYRRQKSEGEPYSVKPKSGRFGYRDWVGVVFGDVTGTLAEPPVVITQLKQRGRSLSVAGQPPRIRFGGWAMNNMEAVTYLYCEQPFYLAENERAQVQLAQFARAMANSGDTGNAILRMALRAALFADGANVSTDAGDFAEARTAFFEITENLFHDLLDKSLTAPEEDRPDLAKRWLHHLGDTAAALFDRFTAPVLQDDGAGERVAKAYGFLTGSFAGYGKMGKPLFESFSLPVPDSKTRRSTKKENA